MTNIYKEYATPHIICVRGKLNRDLTSRDLIGIWMLHRCHP